MNCKVGWVGVDSCGLKTERKAEIVGRRRAPVVCDLPVFERGKGDEDGCSRNDSVVRPVCQITFG
jgi:hypothetical protein